MMGRYIFGRLLQLIPTLFVITVLIFLLAHMAPGDPITAMAGIGASQELIDNIKAQYGLDQPLVVQYGRWILHVLRGDLGTSITTHQSVASMTWDRLEVTLLLAILGTFFSVIIAVPLGILAATRKGTWVDSLAMGFTSLSISVPSFFTAILLIVIFGVQLRWVPFAGYPGLANDFWGSIQRLILPTISVALIYLALLARMVRSEMLEVLRSDFVRTARGKGLRERSVLISHALRNALLPSINLVTLNFASLLGGTVIIEEVFALPGIGRLTIQAVLQRDFPVIQGITLFVGVVFILASLAADLISFKADPRVSL
ncbi:MAG: ABC transporter permease [Thermomicrobiales bacterium]|nr:ABC transporter permease [Thermomicrobiales bacterium]MCO5225929.1 ABC transporter permease [Thermomicrobiales bacterium]MCO5227708.1 ABC transporter permease [Thermomicrobiales bacterium]